MNDAKLENPKASKLSNESPNEWFLESDFKWVRPMSETNEWC